MDGFGDDNSFVEYCLQPPGTTTVGGDCDDTDPAINPDAIEIVNNGIDEDCDGEDLLSLVDKATLDQIKIYPNPAHNYFLIAGFSSTIPENYSISIFSSVGQKIEPIYLENESSALIKIDTKTWPSGIYYLIIRSRSGIHLDKISIAH